MENDNLTLKIIIVIVIIVAILVVIIIIFFLVRDGSNSNGTDDTNGSNNRNGSNGNGSQAKVTIVNSTGEDIWIENRLGTNINNTVPGYTTPIFVANGDSIGFNFPSAGLASVRFWAKRGCDSTGQNCTIGDQLPNPQTGQCPEGGCDPSIDTLFEITSECLLPDVSACNQPPNNPDNRVDFLNMSLVDGYTFPFRLSVDGDTSQCSAGIRNGLDASGLTLDKCPSNETITNTSTNESFDVDLGYFANPSSSLSPVLGCFSPCKKLVSSESQQGLGLSESTFPTVMYCCPTPEGINPCIPENGCVAATTCRQGPVATSQYVQLLAQEAPGNYSYSYDDENGLHTCPNTYKYTLEFLPPE